MTSAFGGEEGYRRYVPVIEAALEMGDPSSLKVKDGRVDKRMLEEMKRCGSVRLLLVYNCFLPQGERWVGRLW